MEKVAVHIVVGPLYKVLKNCLIEACDVFGVKMIQIWTFPAAPSTERVPRLAERVAYLRYSINLRLFSWQVPALVRAENDEQTDHDQGKSEGGEERAFSCSAEDPGETGGEGEIWAELRTLTFLILLFA